MTDPLFISVRPARVEDAPAIAAIHVAGWRAAYRGQMPDPLLDGLSVEERTERRVRQLTAPVDPRIRHLVAESDGAVVAFSVSGPARGDAPAGDGEIYAIYVAPEAWGHGMGRTLLDGTVSSLRKDGFGSLLLWVLDTNARTRRFYEHCGWWADGGEKTEQYGGAPLREVRYRLAEAGGTEVPVTGPGVIFDMDGVLIDSEDLHHRAYNEVLAEFGVQVDRETYGREWIARGTGPAFAAREYDLPISGPELKARKQPVFHRILKAEVRLMPGAAEALARVAAHFPVALATNSNKDDVGYVLGRFDIRRFFTDVVTRERYSEPKPAPDAFLAAAAGLGLEPARCLVVEDTEKGVLAAAAAGIPSVAVPHEFTRDNDFGPSLRVLGSLDALTVDLVRALVG